MNKYALALALIASLSLCALIGTGAVLTAVEDGVELVEKTAYGDSSAAEGLTVEYRIFAASSRVAWDITTRFEGGGIDVDSRLTWRPKADMVNFYAMNVAQLELDELDMSHNVVSGEITDVRELTDYTDVRLTLMLRDVADRTRAGYSRTETLRLSDYGMEQFDWKISARRGALAIPFSMQDKANLKKFSVSSDGLFLKITVGKDEDGYIAGVAACVTDTELPPAERPLSDGSVSRADEDILNNRSVAVIDERGMWLFPSVLDAEDRELVEYPQGRGIYFIPVTEGDPFKLDMGELRPFYNCDGIPLGLKLRDGGTLELIAFTPSGVILTALDAETGEVRSRFTLHDGDSGVEYIVDGEDCCLYIFSDGHYALVEYLDGAPCAALSGEVDLNMGIGDGFRIRDIAGRDSIIAFDGQRLAVCAWDGRIMVLDGEGLEYAGAFRGMEVYGYSATPTAVGFEKR